MRYILILTQLVILGIISCNNEESKLHTFEDSSFKYSCFKYNGSFTGPFTSYYKQGNLHSLGHLIDNKKSGTIISYYSNGFVQSIEQFINGKLIGPIYYFHENGNLKEIASYWDTLYTGHRLNYYINGNLASYIFYGFGGFRIYRDTFEFNGSEINERRHYGGIIDRRTLVDDTISLMDEMVNLLMVAHPPKSKLTIREFEITNNKVPIYFNKEKFKLPNFGEVQFYWKFNKPGIKKIMAIAQLDFENGRVEKDSLTFQIFVKDKNN